MIRTAALLMSSFVTGFLLAGNSLAQSWPTYRHDARRSGVTDESLKFPLQQSWLRESKQPPQTAWTGPAKWDAYAGNTDLQSMRNFDPCFFVTASEGSLFFGSSVDDAVHALDAASGKENWVYFTGAAVRFPPTLDSGHAYFGSDDGFAYCCDQKTGKLIWKRQASIKDERITSNRKLISKWPVRTGVLIQNGHAFFAGSLVPWKTSFLFSVNAETGAIDDGYQSEISGVTLQGALLASTKRLYVPQGRAAPLAFSVSNGKSLGAIGEAGGVYCILTEDEMLLAGPSNQKSADSQIRVADGDSGRRLATFSGASQILVSRNLAWIPTIGKLKMLDRSQYVSAQRKIDAANAIINNKKLSNASAKAAAKKQREQSEKLKASAWKWESDCPIPSGIIKAGDAILIGLKDEVRAYSSKTGDLVWKGSVNGNAHGLAVAGGRLFVSTGLGHIYAFESIGESPADGR